MESLLASYASDEEEDAPSPAGSPVPVAGLASAGNPNWSPFVDSGAQNSAGGALKLPPPKSAAGGAPAASVRSLFATLPPPSTSKHPAATKTAKKVVDFRPPINWALLETAEDDDSKAVNKRAKGSADQGGTKDRPAGTDLFAMLPPPRNDLGARAGLGGGGARGGRRTIVDTATDRSTSVSGMGSGAEYSAQKDQFRQVNLAELNAAPNPEMGISDPARGNESSVQSMYGSYSESGNQQPRSFQGPYVENPAGSGEVWSGGASGGGVHSTANEGFAPQLLAEVTKGKRRRHDELPPEMIEVKQADLTGGSKLREDQLRTTGIAFGPSYKPTSSVKDKPSKLLRRKHQLGSLYYDMKQNEMNLMERRSKGTLTKAETQAKYGW